MIILPEEYLKAPSDTTLKFIHSEARKILDQRKEWYEIYLSSPKNYNNVKIALAKYLVDTATGFYAGKAMKFDFNGDSLAEYKEIVTDIQRENDESDMHYKMVKDYNITGAGYQIMYFDSNTKEIKYTRLNPLECIGVYGDTVENSLVALVRMYKSYDESLNPNVDCMTIYTKTNKYEYIKKLFSTKWQEVNVEDNLLEEVPVFVVEDPDNINLFDRVMPLIKAYEHSLQTCKNIHDYNDKNVKIVIEGHQLPKHGTLARKQFEQDWKEENIINFSSKEGKIWMLSKDINDSALLNYQKALIEMITTTTGIPNMMDESFSGNASGVALKHKLFPLEQLNSALDKMFRACYRRKWRIITDWINTKGKATAKQKQFDINNLDFTFVRNMPIDTASEIDNALKIEPLVGRKIAVTQLPMDINYEDVAKNLEEERNKELDIYNNNYAQEEEKDG